MKGHMSVQDHISKVKAENFEKTEEALKNWSWVLEASEDPLLNVLSSGWMEDGRLGYPADNSSFIQLCPRPVASLRAAKPRKSIVRTKDSQYVCQQVSAGSRHTLFLMVDCRANNVDHKDISYRKVMIAGLNQQGLCEEPGLSKPTEVNWCDAGELPVNIHAGYGHSFVISQFGNVYSWGNGRYGVLGHGDVESNQVPRQIMGLNRLRVKSVSSGLAHAVAVTQLGKVFTWGRNQLGQLGRGFESDVELTLAVIEGFNEREVALDVRCGQNHCLALIRSVSLDGNKTTNLIFAWGDESRGQLGSGDRKFRFKPQENRWMTKLLKSKDIRIQAIAAGGFHNLALTESAGQVISWGAGDYGQLGQGFLWDDAKPKLINDLKDVTFIAAGLRHSVAIRTGLTHEILGWGYNGYGELGMGDLELRLQPSKISALGTGKNLSVSCGDRHTCIVTSHKMLRAKDDTTLRPFYSILEVEDNPGIRNYLKRVMARQDLNPDYLDNPEAILPGQPGMTDNQSEDIPYEKGLRYCMDTRPDPTDWRRKVYEICYDVATPVGMLKAVCLACARHCCSKFRLRPYTRIRKEGDVCGCQKSIYCTCSWSRVRAEFDRVCGKDGSISPRQLRGLLLTLRDPVPLDRESIIDGLISLADGDDQADLPRIKPVPFEKWYRSYFDEYEDISEDN